MLTYEKDFAEFVARLHGGEEIEIDQDLFDYFLEVLPPVRMGTNVEMPDGNLLKTCFLFAEGYEQLTAFYFKPGLKGRRFACQIPYLSDGNGAVLRMRQ